MKSLNKLKPGSKARVAKLEVEGAVRRRFLDMGITPGVEIYMRKVAPFGDPLEINLRGYVLTLRKKEAELIIMEDTNEKE